MAPRRIAHILPWPSVGGVEVATLRTMRAAEGAGLTGVAFVPRGGAAVRALFERGGVPVVEYDPPEPSYRHPLAYLRRSLALARQLRAAGVNVVHCADFLAGFRCGLAGVLARVPVISHVRGRVPYLSGRDRSFLWPIRWFVFVSSETRASFAFPVPERRSSVLYDGIDVPTEEPNLSAEVRAELGIPPAARIIGMVARVAPAKDYPTLIAAAAEVVRAHPEAMFLIVGQRSGVREYSEHFALVSQLLADAGLTSRFIFTDHRDDVDRLVAAMDVCVLTTFAEGLPLALLEAMARGRPFVATNVGGIPEIIQDGDTGVLVPLGDAPALARALTALLDDPSRAAALGAAGRAHVERHFGRVQFQARVRALYDQVFRGGAGTSRVVS
jgi:glycosyltransferase involved in cell wall biosynthesis